MFSRSCADLAGLLREYLAGEPAGERLWASRWWTKAAKMIRAAPERRPPELDRRSRGERRRCKAREKSDYKAREKSDYLTYANADGEVFDFYAQRGQMITALEQSGVSLEDAASPCPAFPCRNDLEALRPQAEAGGCPRRSGCLAGVAESSGDARPDAASDRDGRFAQPERNQNRGIVGSACRFIRWRNYGADCKSAIPGSNPGGASFS